MEFNQSWFFCLNIVEKSTFLFCKKEGKKLFGYVSMLISRLVFLLKHSRKINLPFL